MAQEIRKAAGVVEPTKLPAGAMGFGRRFAAFSQEILDRYAIWENYPWNDAVMQFLEHTEQEEAQEKREPSSFFVTVELLKLYVEQAREEEKKKRAREDSADQREDSAKESRPDPGETPRPDGGKAAEEAELTLRLEAQLELLKEQYDRSAGILERIFREGAGMPEEEWKRIWEAVDRECARRTERAAGLRIHREMRLGMTRERITPLSLGKPWLRLRQLTEGHAHIPNGKERFYASAERQQREFYTGIVRDYVVQETERQAQAGLGRELRPFEHQALAEYGDSLDRRELAFYVANPDARLYEETAALVLSRLAEAGKEGAPERRKVSDAGFSPERPGVSDAGRSPEHTEGKGPVPWAGVSSERNKERPQALADSEKQREGEKQRAYAWPVLRKILDQADIVGQLLDELPDSISREAAGELLREVARELAQGKIATDGQAADHSQLSGVLSAAKGMPLDFPQRDPRPISPLTQTSLLEREGGLIYYVEKSEQGQEEAALSPETSRQALPEEKQSRQAAHEERRAQGRQAAYEERQGLPRQIPEAAGVAAPLDGEKMGNGPEAGNVQMRGQQSGISAAQKASTDLPQRDPSPISPLSQVSPLEREGGLVYYVKRPEQGQGETALPLETRRQDSPKETQYRPAAPEKAQGRQDAPEKTQGGQAAHEERQGLPRQISAAAGVAAPLEAERMGNGPEAGSTAMRGQQPGTSAAPEASSDFRQRESVLIYYADRLARSQGEAPLLSEIWKQAAPEEKQRLLRRIPQAVERAAKIDSRENGETDSGEKTREYRQLQKAVEGIWQQAEQTGQLNPQQRTVRQ